jgi:hypothetical protein
MRPLTVAPRGTLDLALAPTATITLVGRQALPYVPAYMTVQGTHWDLVTVISGQLTVAWRERNRITQGDQLIDQSQGTVTAEPGTTYIIELIANGGIAFATFTDITGSGWTWPTPDDTHSILGIKLSAVRDGLTSYQSQVMAPVTRTGWGLGYGNVWGG